MSTCACCQSFYTPLDYTTDQGYCVRCMSSATPTSYQSKEWVCANVTDSNPTNKQDTYHE